MVHSDGAASLHTRSLKYGKLRNGMFLAVSGTGGGGGVVRARRQVWTVSTPGGDVDVHLGVNGYIWISKHVEPIVTGETSITRLEESASSVIYSSQNEEIPLSTRCEIARLRGCVTALVENGVRVDEDMVMRTYEACLEVESDWMVDVDEGAGSGYLGGEKGRRVVQMALASINS